MILINYIKGIKNLKYYEFIKRHNTTQIKYVNTLKKQTQSCIVQWKNIIFHCNSSDKFFVEFCNKTEVLYSKVSACLFPFLVTLVERCCKWNIQVGFCYGRSQR